jgi:hypothetical protein
VLGPFILFWQYVFRSRIRLPGHECGVAARSRLVAALTTRSRSFARATLGGTAIKPDIDVVIIHDIRRRSSTTY